ncbi:hypothetical protein [Niabella aquatica]
MQYSIPVYDPYLEGRKQVATAILSSGSVQFVGLDLTKYGEWYVQFGNRGDGTKFEAITLLPPDDTNNITVDMQTVREIS